LVLRSGSDLTAPRQRLPALCPRPLGAAPATARGYGRRGHREVCRRYCRRLRARDRRPTLLGRNARSLAGVLAVTAPGEDPPDRVWQPRGGQARATRARETGDLKFPGL